MVAGLPLIKLGGLFIKQLAKPVAKRLKKEAEVRPNLYKSCVQVGQLTHKVVSWINITAAGHKSMGIKELEPSAAFARGADFLSETFIFSVGVGVLIFEVSRSNMSSSAKEREKVERNRLFKESLEARFAALERRLEAIEKWQQEKDRKPWTGLFPAKPVQRITASPSTHSTQTPAAAASPPSASGVAAEGAVAGGKGEKGVALRSGELQHRPANATDAATSPRQHTGALGSPAQPASLPNILPDGREGGSQVGGGWMGWLGSLFGGRPGRVAEPRHLHSTVHASVTAENPSCEGHDENDLLEPADATDLEPVSGSDSVGETPRAQP